MVDGTIDFRAKREVTWVNGVPAETQVSAKMKTKMNKRLKRLYLS
jgi:hypothetical protein